MRSATSTHAMALLLLALGTGRAARDADSSLELDRDEAAAAASRSTAGRHAGQVNARQEFAFVLNGVKTARQQETTRAEGKFPKTINLAVKFRVEDTAGGEYVDCVVRKQMGKSSADEKCDMPKSQASFPWYNNMYDIVVQDCLKITDGLPQQIYWELVSLTMATRLMREYTGKDSDHPKIIGVSVMLQVDGTQTLLPHGNPSYPNLDPGSHGPITTIGDITPWDYNTLSFSSLYKGTFDGDSTLQNLFP